MPIKIRNNGFLNVSNMPKGIFIFYKTRYKKDAPSFCSVLTSRTSF